MKLFNFDKEIPTDSLSAHREYEKVKLNIPGLLFRIIGVLILYGLLLLVPYL